jgi:Zn-dependent metalloprotease
MKKFTILAAALLASALYAAPAADQQAEAAKARQAEMLKQIQAELGLSDKQTQQWGEIHERYLKAHMKLRVEQNNEIEALLNDEQQKKFEAMQQRFRERLNQRMGAQQ